MMVVQGTFDKRCLMVEVPTELSILTTCLSIFFTLITIAGNIFIILAVVLDPNKNLRTPFNWLVLNLATADLIVGVITQPMTVHIHVKEALKQEITIQEKMAVQMSYFISCTASVLSLSSLAVERYLAVRKPNAYRCRVTNKRIFLTVVGIWLISLGLPNLYFKIGISKYRFIFSNTSLAVASVIICVTYTFMLRKVKGSSQNLGKESVRRTPFVTSTSSSSTVQEIEHSPDQELSNSNKRAPTAITNKVHILEERVTKMFIVVLIALLSCYGPSAIMVYMITFCKSCSCTTLNWLREFHFMFVLANSSVNFFCYACQSPRFRSAFMKLLQGKPSRFTVSTFFNFAHSSDAINNTEESNSKIDGSQTITHEQGTAF